MKRSSEQKHAPPPKNNSYGWLAVVVRKSSTSGLNGRVIQVQLFMIHRGVHSCVIRTLQPCLALAIPPPSSVFRFCSSLARVLAAYDAFVAEAKARAEADAAMAEPDARKRNPAEGCKTAVAKAQGIDQGMLGRWIKNRDRLQAALDAGGLKKAHVKKNNSEAEEGDDGGEDEDGQPKRKRKAAPKEAEAPVRPATSSKVSKTQTTTPTAPTAV